MERERQDRAREENRPKRHIVRQCCSQPKIINHVRPPWQPNFIWERNEFIMNAEAAKKKMTKQQKLVAERMKDVRALQFRNFIEDVFVKYDQGKFKDKVAWDLKFTKEEREEWVDKIFKKFYTDGPKVNEITVRIPISESGAMQRRRCSCVVGEIDEKTGDLVPAAALAAKRGSKTRYITIKKAPSIVTEEMKQAQLGNSLGMKTKMNVETLNEELDKLMSKRAASKKAAAAGGGLIGVLKRTSQ